ncbi:MAG TPA: PGPGW domain-containing protein [Candidatus Limnocylindrales bacterium]|nr:PGPGW domain-containing protein [Candidatus Limnocylindrales bacterium]
MSEKFKRIGTDAAGYVLIVLGIAFSPLPGPGGLPLVLAGLGLLSIHNEWARRLRERLLDHGGKIVEKLFPNNPTVQWLYDAVVGMLLVLVAVLAWRHAAIWQITLASFLFFIALLIAGLNRDRATRLKNTLVKHKK